MPHRRKAKKEFNPQLQFEPENSFLYLSYNGEDEDTLSVSVDTFVIIFAIKFCDIKNIKFRQEYNYNKFYTIKELLLVVSLQISEAERRVKHCIY